MFLVKKNNKSIRSVSSEVEFYSHVVMEVLVPYSCFVNKDLALQEDLWEHREITGEYVFSPNIPAPIVALNHSTMLFYQRFGLFDYRPVDVVEHAKQTNGRIDDLYMRGEKGLTSVANCWGAGASLLPYSEISTVWTTLEVFAWELQCVTENQGCRIYEGFKALDNYRYCYDGFRRAYIANITQGWDGRNPMPAPMRELAGDEDQIRHLFNYQSSKIVHQPHGTLREVLEFFSTRAEDCEIHFSMIPAGVLIEMGADKKYLPWLYDKIKKADESNDILKIHEDLE